MDELKAAVVDATSLDDYQDIGRRCREILIEVAREVFELGMVPANERQPGASDAKRMLGYFFSVAYPGSSNVDKHLRALMEAAFDLANSVTHGSSTGTHAFASPQATVMVVRVAQASKLRMP